MNINILHVTNGFAVLSKVYAWCHKPQRDQIRGK